MPPPSSRPFGTASGPGLACSARGLLLAAADDEPLGVASLLDLFEPVRAVVRAARRATRHIDDGYEAVSIFFGASEARVLERRFSSGRRGSGWRRLAEHGLPVEPFALGEVLAPDPG
jgi:hypothetical protein